MAQVAAPSGSCNTQPSRSPMLLLLLALAACSCPVHAHVRNLHGFSMVVSPVTNYVVPTPAPTPTPTSVPTTPRPSPIPPPRPSPIPPPRPSPIPPPRPSPIPPPRPSPRPTTTPTPTSIPKPTPTPTPTPQIFPARSPITDVAYPDDNIHFTQLIRFSDWNSMAWGAASMTAGTRITYNKFGVLPYTSWRFLQDPVYNAAGASNTILMSNSVVHVVSRDGKLAWSCTPDGYVTLVDYATALQGDMSLIRARIFDKHGQVRMIGASLPRGFQWSKMKFGAFGGSEVTPTDSGLAWQPQSDASYIANRKAWEYGFEVQDVDYLDSTILKKN